MKLGRTVFHLHRWYLKANWIIGKTNVTIFGCSPYTWTIVRFCPGKVVTFSLLKKHTSVQFNYSTALILRHWSYQIIGGIMPQCVCSLQFKSFQVTPEFQWALTFEVASLENSANIWTSTLQTVWLWRAPHCCPSFLCLTSLWLKITRKSFALTATGLITMVTVACWEIGMVTKICHVFKKPAEKDTGLLGRIWQSRGIPYI